MVTVPLWRRMLAPAAAVSLATAIWRPIPLYLSLPFLVLAVSVLLLVGRNTLHALVSKRFAVNTALFLAAVAISGMLAELGARYLLPRDAVSGWLYQYDPECTFLLRPNGYYDALIQVSATDQQVVEQRVSSQGVRDRVYGPKAPDEYRILMLGDSFTFGHTVPEEETIPKQLERLLASEGLPKRVSVINAGLLAAGPLQELGMLRKYGLALDPDLVVLQLYPENDIDDCLATVGKVQRAYNVGARRLRRIFQQQAFFPFRAERWVNLHSRLYRQIKRVMGSDSLIVGMFQRLRFYPEFRAPSLPRTEKRRFDFEVNLKTWYPELDEGMSLYKRYILDIRAECQRHNLDLIVYSIPSFRELKNCDEPDSKKLYDEPGLYERYKAMRRVDAFLNEEHIPAVSVLEALEAPERTSDVYYIYDGHLNPHGNAVVAGILNDYLAKTYFPTDRRLANSRSAS